MPITVPPVIAGRHQHNLTVTARSGKTIAAGTPAHTKGAWTSIIDPTNAPSYGIYVDVWNIGVGATVTSYLIDIGVGPSGGGGEQVLIPDLDAAAATTLYGGNTRGWYFPVYIPAGVRVSARGQAVTAGDNATLIVHLMQRPLYPTPVARWVAYGVVSASSYGTAVTPGNGAWGAWTNVGSVTSRAHNYWHVGFDLQTTTSALNSGVLVEIGYQVGAADYSIGVWTFYEKDNESIVGPTPSLPLYHPVPAGTQLRARIASGGTAARGVIIYGGD